MTTIPRSIADAQNIIERAREPHTLEHEDLASAWAAAAFLYPGMHADNDEAEIPQKVRALWREVWKRHTAGGLDEAALYPVSACRSRILMDIEHPAPEDHAPGDRFFGTPSATAPSAVLHQPLPTLLVDSNGIVQSLHATPAEALAERDTAHPGWGICFETPSPLKTR